MHHHSNHAPLPRAQYLNSPCPPGTSLQFVKGNIQTADLVRYVLETEEIDTVMHFAAQVRGLVGSALESPLQRDFV